MFPTAHGVVSQGGEGAGPPLAGLTFIASQDGGHSSASTTTITVPTGAQEGDILVVALAQNSNSQIPTDSDGWTIIHTALNPNADRPTWLAYIVLPHTPPANYTWTFSGASNRVWAVAAFRGQHAVNPILDDDWNQGSASPPALTAVAGCAAFGAWRRAGAGAPAAPTAMTALVTDLAVGSNVSITVAYETGVAAGAYSRTAGSTPNNLNASMVLIRPA